MGVPKLFKIILDNFPRSHSKLGEKGTEIDYLMVDFNNLIYEAYEGVKQEIEEKNGRKKISQDEVERRIIERTIEKAGKIVRVVRPRKLVYLALDGCPPRGKMIEQRNRRYKKMMGNKVLAGIKRKWERDRDVEQTRFGGNGEGAGELWDTRRISPGSRFMWKLGKGLEKAVERGEGGGFPENLQYVVSGVEVPGEGEHKFLSFLDALPDGSRVGLASSDGDILILANRFPQHHVLILARARETFDKLWEVYRDEPFMVIHHQEVMKGLAEGMEQRVGKEVLSKNGGKLLAERLIMDFSFFTMLGGNDFVKHLYFLRMKESHSYKVMLEIYGKLLGKFGYLIGDDGTTINNKFFIAFMEELGNVEQKWSQVIQRKIQRDAKQVDRGSRQGSRGRSRQGSRGRSRSRSQRSRSRGGSVDSFYGGGGDRGGDPEGWEEEWAEFQHRPFYDRGHIWFDKYREVWGRINFFGPEGKWKWQYYKEFFGVNYSQDRKAVARICRSYIKSLIWCFKYYFGSGGVPSWTWYYPHGASPMASDVVKVLRELGDINKAFEFEKGRPFSPLEQAMLILPQGSGILPKKLDNLMGSPKLKEYYPDKFELEVLWGQKWIYSEPKLPKINAKRVLEEMKKVKLSEEEMELDEVKKFPLVFR